MMDLRVQAALNQLTSALESHSIAIGNDEARRATDAQGFATWVQEHLHPDTLLSSEEEAL